MGRDKGTSVVLPEMTVSGSGGRGRWAVYVRGVGGNFEVSDVGEAASASLKQNELGSINKFTSTGAGGSILDRSNLRLVELVVSTLVGSTVICEGETHTLSDNDDDVDIRIAHW